MDDLETRAETMLKLMQKNKRRHKDGDQCQGKKECTGCHFWSGAISVLSELLGRPGIID